jgi:hypothetical protein
MAERPRNQGINPFLQQNTLVFEKLPLTKAVWSWILQLASLKRLSVTLNSPLSSESIKTMPQACRECFMSMSKAIWFV